MRPAADVVGLGKCFLRGRGISEFGNYVIQEQLFNFY